jgi:membrane protease YdiL (CAAX protease family)
MRRTIEWIGRNPLVSFFTLAFVFTWSSWVPRALASHGLTDGRVPDFMFIVAGYGPALAGIIVSWLINGRMGLVSLGRRLCHWRVGIVWYVVALFLPAAQTVAAFGLRLLFGGEIPNSSAAPFLQVGPAGTSLWIQTVIMILMFTLGFDGIGEELGWRGFALPRLLARYPALGASVVMGAIWALWHLPYALTKGSAMADNPLGYLPQMFAASILFTWIFNNTKGSVLLAILFHAAGNVTFNVLPQLLPGVYDSGIWGEIVRWLVVGTVIAFARPTNCQIAPAYK